jgi:regulator of replication initiation timing
MVSDELTRELYAKINQLEQEKMALHDLLEEAENCIDQLYDDVDEFSHKYEDMCEAYGALIIENEDLQKMYDELKVDYIAAKSQL